MARPLAYFLTLAACTEAPPPAEPGEAGSHAALDVPEGFTEVTLSPGGAGVRAFARAERDWVLTVDLGVATLRSLHGMVEPHPVDHGFDLVRRVGEATFVELGRVFSTDETPLLAVVSGTHFDGENDPCGLAFGLVVAERRISLGYEYPGGPRELFPGLQQLLAVDQAAGRAWLTGYDLETFVAAPDVIGSLDVRADKGFDDRTGRTFVGLRDVDDGGFRTVIFYLSASATQAQAGQALVDFGAEQATMMTGGGNTVLHLGGELLIEPKRTVPHVFAIYGGAQ